ncbi:hypothetical protein AVEN_127951-1 [Araneus ventricosus]|uniref:Uncharacterized protein n=1 Tax=Araneus ventricosus TaxID=182803 RepID=A0A4Y2A083_ARAVE|nr:hypothetical protein AVEN_127951-1 [Araneus ventricosus]
MLFLGPKSYQEGKTSRFEATRGLIWDVSRNFEPQPDDDTCAGTPSPSFLTTPQSRRLATMYALTCNGPTYGGSSVVSGFKTGSLRS